MQHITAKNGVEFLHSELIPVPHGFSTRLGGVSMLPHTASLDLGFAHGEGDEVTAENLRRFCEAVGVSAESVVTPSQIHSAQVRTVGVDAAGLGWSRPAWPELCCDGLVTVTPSVTAGVRTADCVPILLYVEKGGVCAVSAIHSGWRGTSARIVCEGIRCLLSAVPGADASDITAAIGPHIGKCCYEVGEDFHEAFDAELREHFVLPDPHKTGKYRADLTGANEYLLKAAGVREANIDICRECTCCNPGLYYSHRGQHGLRGSMLSVISPRNK